MKILTIIVASLITGVIAEAEPWPAVPGAGISQREADSGSSAVRLERVRNRRGPLATIRPGGSWYKREAEPNAWQPVPGMVYAREAEPEAEPLPEPEAGQPKPGDGWSKREASPWNARPGRGFYKKREASPWNARPGRGFYKKRDALPWNARPGRGFYKKREAEAEAEAEPEAWHPRPGPAVYGRDAEPGPWHPRPGPAVYGRDAEAEPWHPRPGPAVYGRDAKPVADDKIPLMAREAEPEPARFQPLGEIRRDSTPAPTEE